MVFESQSPALPVSELVSKLKSSKNWHDQEEILNSLAGLKSAANAASDEVQQLLMRQHIVNIQIAGLNALAEIGKGDPSTIRFLEKVKDESEYQVISDAAASALEKAKV